MSAEVPFLDELVKKELKIQTVFLRLGLDGKI